MLPRRHTSQLPLPDPPLSSDALAVREWRATDLPAVVAACADPAIARFAAPIAAPYSDVAARMWLAGREPARIAGLRLDLAVVSADAEDLLGSIALAHTAEHRRATVSFWVVPQARGQGVATEAVRLIAAWTFGVLGLERLELFIEPENVVSQRVADRCGFVREGLLRAHLIRRGERRDSVVYGLLEGDLR